MPSVQGHATPRTPGTNPGQRGRSDDVDEAPSGQQLGRDESARPGAEELAELERRERALAPERLDLRPVGHDGRVERLVGDGRRRPFALALDERGGLLVVVGLDPEALVRREHQRRLAAVEDLGGEGDRRRSAVLRAHLARIINRCIGSAKRIGGGDPGRSRA
jgi:hypothetical protein